MLFSDPAYLFLFFPLVVAGAALVARVARTEAVLTFLFLASCLFYVGWGVDYLVTMLASILVNWLAAHLLLRLEDGRRALRRGIFLVGLAANLGALIYFKYAFYFDVWAPEAGSAAAAPSFEPGLIAIPVGISFYTFQQIVFLQDALRRDTHVVDYIGAARGMGATAAGFIRYASFVAFFPQLVIGPIVYLSEFAPQVQRRGFGLIRRADLEIGLFIFVVGLFKKIVVADNLAYIVDPVFEAAGAGEKIGTLAAWAAAFGYYAQLYFDFSGYSDMALGSARMLGIVLPINFASPLKADSISDYYKRWHVTLTRVIARFLYTPLSLWGARVAARYIGWRPLRRFPLIWLPLLANFMVIALWHGAAETFLLFGLLHGLWYVLETEIRQSAAWRWWRARVPAPRRVVLGKLVLTVPMVITFTLFRADSIETWQAMLGAMFALPSAARPEEVHALAIAFAVVSLCWVLPNVYEVTRDHKPAIFTWSYPPAGGALGQLAWQPSLAWGAVTAGALVATLYFVGRLPPFLYLGF